MTDQPLPVFLTRSIYTIGVAVFWTAIHLPAAAAEAPANCYRLNLTDSPATTVLSRTIPEPQTWCYQHLSDPTGAVYVYNVDSDHVRPETAAIIDANGEMTHGSLLEGKVSFHRVNAKDFNPLPVPTEEPRTITGLTETATAADPKSESAANTLAVLRNAVTVSHEVTVSAVDSLQPMASASYLPWRGYWWPFKSQAMGGSSNSPLGKYDQFAQVRDGFASSAAAWERANHRSHGVWWEGHCNGWAASSLLERQPTTTRVVGGVSFSVSDQKGILAEANSCTINTFIGRRNDGGGDPNDVYPAVFHKTLLYYIGSLGKPVIMDYRRDSAVDNNVISGYQMSMQRTGANSYVVTARLRVHKYDGFRTNVPGIAPTVTKIYKYTLMVDGRGTPVGGQWLSDNPDFLWIPLSKSNCSSKNPALDLRTVGSIVD